jgi:hypothetical protein
MAIFGSKSKNSFIFLLVLLFTSLSFLVISPTQAQTAGVYFSPSSGQFKTGDSVTVNLYIDSAKDTIDALSGAVSFTQDTLQVTSLSRSGSILNLWTQEPTFSNTNGTINFKGTALNRGFNGSGGKVLAITFKVIQSGPTYVTYTFGSVLANGDQDTSPLSLGGRAQFTIVGSDTEKDNENNEEVDTDSDLPIVSRIVSSTHPDQNKWYTNTSPEVTWNVPKGTLEVRADVSESINTKPSVSYIPPISEKRITALSDGRHCFNLSLRNIKGWGSVSHYCFNIDTAPPKHFIIDYHDHGLSFKTIDEGSGLSHYIITIDGQNIIEHLLPDPFENFFNTQFLNPGIHTISITAVDNAGNSINATKEIVVEGINPPIITYYTSSLEAGGDIKMSGTTYPYSLVTLYLRQDEKVIYTKTVTSNEAGKFTLVISKPLQAGIYSLAAKVIDKEKIESNETAQFMIIVTFKLISEIVEAVLRYLSMIIIGLLALGSIVSLGIYIWFRIIRLIGQERAKLETKAKIIKKKSRR